MLSCGRGRAIPVRCWEATLCGATRAHHASSRRAARPPCLQRGGAVRWRRPDFIVCRHSCRLEWRRCRRGYDLACAHPQVAGEVTGHAECKKGRVRVTGAVLRVASMVSSAAERVPRAPGVAAWPWVLELQLGGVPRCAHLTSSSLCLMHHYCPSRLNALHVWRGHHSLHKPMSLHITRKDMNLNVISILLHYRERDRQL